MPPDFEPAPFRICPSGDPTPSRDDVAITKVCAAALEKLDIRLHDHVVVGRKGHASLRSLGLIS